MSNALFAMGQAAAAGTDLGGAWDLSSAYYDPDLAWDFVLWNNAVYKSFSVASQQTTPQGLFFKPDGTKMYVVGSAAPAEVGEYTLSTAWDVSTASHIQDFGVSTEDLLPNDIFFKPDGTKMYILGASGDDVGEYDLSTAWDISTASYLQNFNVSTQETSPNGLFFKPDGTKMYVVGAGTDTVHEYNLSTAWDVSTGSYVHGFSVSTQDTIPQSVSFKPDGTKMFVIGWGGDDINEYALSTAWDVSTASFTRNTFALAGGETNPTGLFFKPDGTMFYVVGTTVDTVNQYELGGFYVGTEELVPSGVFFKPDGTKMFISGTNGDEVNEYSLGTAWDVSTASYTRVFSVAAQDTSPQSLFFKPDGTKMYIMGNTGDDVNEYSLSTAWDVSTASYVQVFSVTSQETSPQGLFFKPDGTKMYIVGQSGVDVNEYALSTAWDISTASYVQAFSVAPQDSLPTEVSFKPDGTQMFVVGDTNDAIYQYRLSTAWDISTASYMSTLSVANQGTSPQGLFFKPDGTKMFMITAVQRKVFGYTLLNNQ